MKPQLLRGDVRSAIATAVAGATSDLVERLAWRTAELRSERASHEINKSELRRASGRLIALEEAAITLLCEGDTDQRQRELWRVRLLEELAAVLDQEAADAAEETAAASAANRD